MTVMQRFVSEIPAVYFSKECRLRELDLNYVLMLRVFIPERVGMTIRGKYDAS